MILALVLIFMLVIVPIVSTIASAEACKIFGEKNHISYSFTPPTSCLVEYKPGKWIAASHIYVNNLEMEAK